MSDKIELTEEQANALLSWFGNYDPRSCDQIKSNWKEKGYIKQDPVERALEIIDKAKKRYKHHMDIQIEKPEFDEIENTILYLKKQLEEKHNE